MAVESKFFSTVPTASRRYFVWVQIVIAFLFLELAIWAPTTQIRNRWGTIALITILVLVLIDVLIDRPRSGVSASDGRSRSAQAWCWGSASRRLLS